MRAFLLGMALLGLLAGCQGDPGVEGKYAARTPDGRAVTLTLKAGYQGEWETATDSVPLRWEMRDGQLWLHSKSGGVVRGVLENGSIRVALPEEEELVFSRPDAKAGG